MNQHENKHAEGHTQGHEHGNKSGKHYKHYAKLAPFSLAMASGLVYGVSVLIVGLLITKGHISSPMLRMLGTGDIWSNGLVGFVGGFVTALVFAWVYNSCLSCWVCRSKCSKCGSHCCKC